jgi:hypothetical protein
MLYDFTVRYTSTNIMYEAPKGEATDLHSNCHSLTTQVSFASIGLFCLYIRPLSTLWHSSCHSLTIQMDCLNEYQHCILLLMTCMYPPPQMDCLNDYQHCTWLQKTNECDNKKKLAHKMISEQVLLTCC